MMNIKRILKRIKLAVTGDTERAISRQYFKNYMKYAFVIGNCKSPEQYEGCITRLYHTIEKGLSYENYRPGFGEANVCLLISEMEKYVASGYDTSRMFYQTALDALKKYVQKNKDYDVVNPVLEKQIEGLAGEPNSKGGTIAFCPDSVDVTQTMGYEAFVKSRHSIRHFSSEAVDMNRLIHALEIAQHTPSACNRQGWKTFIIANQSIIEKVLKNQNGNKGFGQEINKLLVVVGDIQYYNRDRELHQVFIDTGMYAMSIINALHYEGIGSIPLSGSLRRHQERNIRKLLGMSDAEVIAMFIGIGNYPAKVLTTRSERHEARYTIVS